MEPRPSCCYHCGQPIDPRADRFIDDEGNESHMACMPDGELGDDWHEPEDGNGHG